MASARMIQNVKKQLEASGVRILGAVLNKVSKKNSHESGYYGNYYGKDYLELANALDKAGYAPEKYLKKAATKKAA